MSLTLVQSRWQGWIIRSQCCHRHHRKIQTIARLSPPAVFTSALFVERRGGRGHREEDQDTEEEAAEPGLDVSVADIGRARFPSGRRGECCCRCPRPPRTAAKTAGLSPEKRPPGRRWICSGCPYHGCRTRHRRGKDTGERSRLRRGAPRARRTLLSFVLSLPSDVSCDLCPLIAGTGVLPSCPRWIVTLTRQ